jgi:hypothetical protein
MPEAPAAAPPSSPAAPTSGPMLNSPPIPPSPAMQKAFGAMDDFTGQPKRTDPKTPAKAPSKTPEAKPKEPAKEPVKAPEPEPEAEVDLLEEGDEPAEEPAAEPTEPKSDPKAQPKAGDVKQNPWKLVESYKSKAAKLEKQLADVTNGKAASPEFEAKLKGAEERAQAAEKRAKELADHMQFVDYQKSDEFVSKFQKPYEEACKSAADDLTQLSIDDGSGTTRRATMADLMALCSMELGQARQQANAWFGDSADDVMDHRRQIQRLYRDQQKALEDAKGKGEERFKAQTESITKLRDETATLWQKFNTEAAQKHESLKPKEGDDEYNSKLEYGKSLVDKAFGGNALDPRLAPEDRAKLVQAQVAVRNRAIAYSTLKLENKRLQAKLSESEKALKEFQESEPVPGRGKASNGKPGKAADPKQAAFQRMEANYVT